MLIHRDKLFAVMSAVVMLPVLLFLIIILYFSRINNVSINFSENSQVIEPEHKFIYFSQLTGEGVFNKEDESPRVVAVMLNNNPEGHPIIGLNEANVVYEVPVEGSFTRFMVIYARHTTAEEVGPVRSARPYYLDWLSEYGNGLFMHCGGSQESLNLIKRRSVFNADEFYRTKYYWRDKTKVAPHNLYTNSDKWNKYIEDYSANQEHKEWTGWLFGELTATSAEKTNKISVEYSRFFNVSWIFDEDNNNYYREVNDEIFLDKNKQKIIAENIIIQLTSIRVIDELGRRSIEAIGQGDARVLRNGLMIRAKWKKESLDSRTVFFDEDGDQIVLAPGKTWMMIAPLKTNIIVSN